MSTELKEWGVVNNDPQICGVVERFFAMRKVGEDLGRRQGGGLRSTVWGLMGLKFMTPFNWKCEAGGHRELKPRRVL